jgi:phage terminase large subunit
MPPLAPAKNQITEAEAKEILAYYSVRPTLYITDVLRATPWSKQSEIIQAIFKYPIVAVKSCNASGKSYIAARIALTFLQLKPGSIVITTAPTWRQVKDVLWREFRSAYARAAYKLSKAQCNQVGLDLAEDWFAVGISTNDAEKFFGYHADDILVIIDEASGVEEETYIGVDAVTPNLNAHVLMIGNPTNPDGRFAKSFKNPLVKCITITAFDTPNFTANGIRDEQDLREIFAPPPGVEPLEHMVRMQKELKSPFPALANPSKIYQRLIQWGTDHPMWEALVMAEFPSQGVNSLIPLNLIEKSIEVWRQMTELMALEKRAKTNPAAAKLLREYNNHPEWVVPYSTTYEYGNDVARFGDDSTVLFPRLGGYVEKAQAWGKTATDITADRIVEAINLDDWRAHIKVDDTGVGGGVVDQLMRHLRENPHYHYTVMPINFSEGTTNPKKYFNLRSEMFWNLREQFYNHKIAIPPDEDLMAELSAIRYEYGGKERNLIKIEEKADTKKRLQHSPDRADALMLAFARPQAGTFLRAEEKPPPAGNVGFDGMIGRGERDQQHRAAPSIGPSLHDQY